MSPGRSVLLGLLASPFSFATAQTSCAFSWPSYPNLSYADALLNSIKPSTYALKFAAASTLLPDQVTTVWPSIATPNDSAAKYGNVAWSAQWKDLNITAPPFTTTVAPTPIPSSELVKPTPLPWVEDPTINEYKFPEGFVYGFAGAALQVEGAVKMEGRGPSLIELGLQTRYDTLEGGGPPDVTALNYFLYKQDIARLAAVGVQTYSFTISWSRILPFGVAGSPVNQEGIDHYEDLIQTILDYGMTPVITLHHFDTPLYFMTNTSWQGYDHPEFVEGFFYYAKTVLRHYADRVPYWVSFNEPTLDAANIGNWASSRNIVVAHSRIVHWYRDEMRGSGNWGIKVAFNAGGFSLPLDPKNVSDVAAAERSLDFNINYLANPLILGIDPPDSIFSTLGSRAPVYTKEELSLAKGTCDFFGIDIYTVSYTTPSVGGIEACARNSSHLDFPYCTKIVTERDNWQVGAKSQGTSYMMYQHFRTVLQYFHSKYPTHLGILIGEYGFPIYSAASMSLESVRTDISQTVFYQSILAQILKAINEDGVKMLGVIGWSFVDNWEWGQYNDRYGVQTFNSTTLERSYKRAIFDYVEFVRNHTWG